MSQSRALVVAFADTHAGSKLGLMPPDAQLLDDTGPEPRTWTPTQTAIQRWLWDRYTEDMAAVRDIAGRAPVVVVLNGDITQGVRYPEACVSTRAADQYAIGLANLEPWYGWRNLSAVCLVHGTGSHEFGEGSAPVTIAAELAKRYPRVRTFTTRHGLLDVDGARVDAAHHGTGPGGRAWLRGNTLRYYTRSLMISEIERGRTPPVALVRAHYHDGVHETVREGGYICEAVVLPSYCGLTHYAIQVTSSAYLLSCGMAAFVFESGRLVATHELWRQLDLRQEERV